MNRKAVTSFRNKIKTQEKLLAARRDAIRALAAEFEMMAEAADRALDALNEADYALSELV